MFIHQQRLNGFLAALGAFGHPYSFGRVGPAVAGAKQVVLFVGQWIFFRASPHAKTIGNTSNRSEPGSRLRLQHEVAQALQVRRRLQARQQLVCLGMHRAWGLRLGKGRGVPQTKNRTLGVSKCQQKPFRCPTALEKGQLCWKGSYQRPGSAIVSMSSCG